jgi:hypothetical protein
MAPPDRNHPLKVLRRCLRRSRVAVGQAQRQPATARSPIPNHTKHCNIFFLAVSQSHRRFFLPTPGPFSSWVGALFPCGFRDMNLNDQGFIVLGTSFWPLFNGLCVGRSPRAVLYTFDDDDEVPTKHTDGDEELGIHILSTPRMGNHLLQQPGFDSANASVYHWKTGTTTIEWPPPSPP